MIGKNEKSAGIIFEYGIRGLGNTNTSGYTRIKCWRIELEDLTAETARLGSVEISGEHFPIPIAIDKIDGDRICFRCNGTEYCKGISEEFTYSNGIAYDTELVFTMQLTDTHSPAQQDAMNEKAKGMVNTSPEQAFAIWMKLSEEGHAKGANNVGWCYNYGRGIEQNGEKAVMYYKLAIMRGYEAAHGNLGTYYYDQGEINQAIEEYIAGMEGKDSFSVLMISCLIHEGKYFYTNDREVARYAAYAYELAERDGYMLALCYATGTFFPRVYSYAKYCIQHSDIDEANFLTLFEKPAYWDEVEPIKPEYPPFDWDNAKSFTAPCPRILLEQARELYASGEEEKRKEAQALCLQAAEQGYSQAMAEMPAFGFDEATCEKWCEVGAKQYADQACIEYMAIRYTAKATYVIGEAYLNEALVYWNKRKKIHAAVPMEGEVARVYERHAKKFKRSVQNELLRKNQPRVPDGDGENALLVRTDGRVERIRVAFSEEMGVCKPLNCEKVLTAKTQKTEELSNQIGQTAVVCHAYGAKENDFALNGLAQALCGEEVYGNAVICGIYAFRQTALSESALNALCEYLQEEFSDGDRD